MGTMYGTLYDANGNSGGGNDALIPVQVDAQGRVVTRHADAFTWIHITPDDSVTFSIPTIGGLWCTAAATLVVTSNNLDITISVPANTRIPILVTQIKATGTNLNGGSLFGLA